MPRPAHRQELYRASAIIEAPVGDRPCSSCDRSGIEHESWCPTRLDAVREAIRNATTNQPKETRQP